jgi:predicted ATPase
MAHLRIGRVLAAVTPTETLKENLFDIVNQFDRGAALIVAQEERERVTELNLMAGQRAKAAIAYDAALRSFTAGRALLGDTGWERCYRLTFDLELHWAKCEYLIGELASAEERLAMLSIRAETTIDSAAVTCLRINLHTTLDQSDSAVRVGLEYLRQVDGSWLLHATAEDVRRNLEKARQALGRIVETNHRAGDVVDRIRALINKAPPRKDRMDINEAIREMIELTRGEAVKTGVSVRTHLADGLPLIHGDRVQLQQVILNLIINAVEAMNRWSSHPISGRRLHFPNGAWGGSHEGQRRVRVQT